MTLEIYRSGGEARGWCGRERGTWTRSRPSAHLPFPATYSSFIFECDFVWDRRRRTPTGPYSLTLRYRILFYSISTELLSFATHSNRASFPRRVIIFLCGVSNSNGVRFRFFVVLGLFKGCRLTGYIHIAEYLMPALTLNVPFYINAIFSKEMDSITKSLG